MLPNKERVLYTPRPKSLGLFAACLLFVAVGVWMVVRGEWEGWLGVGFFGLCSVTFLVMAMPGASFLRLDAVGFCTRTLFRSHSVRWADVDRFGVAWVGLNKMVVFNFASGHDRHTLGRQAAAVISGWEAALPDSYGMSPEALAELLSEYKKAAWLEGLERANPEAQMRGSSDGIRTDLS